MVMSATKQPAELAQSWLPRLLNVLTTAGELNFQLTVICSEFQLHDLDDDVYYIVPAYYVPSRYNELLRMEYAVGTRRDEAANKQAKIVARNIALNKLTHADRIALGL